MTVISTPAPYFTDASGDPLDNGYVYIGEDGLDARTNLITVYWDEALTETAEQPIRTSGGYPTYQGTAKRIFANSATVSMTVLNKYQRVIFNELSLSLPASQAAHEALIADLADTGGAALIGTSDGGTVQDFVDKAYVINTYTAIAAATVPAPVDQFRTLGYAAIGDGGGGNYKRVGSEPSHPGKAQSDDGAWWELVTNVPNVLQFGYFAGDATLDDELDDALEFAAGGVLYAPEQGTPYLVAATHIVPADTTILGDGLMDYWTDDETVGTIFKTSGAGVAARWTDIDGLDGDDDTPVFVAGGNNVYFRNLTVLTEGTPWSMGIFFPCVKQCGLQRVSIFGFTDGCCYLDATWSDRNTTLIALHPTVATDSGMNEFYADDFHFIAGAGGFAVKIQGTTRAGDSVATAGDWLWGWGGTSDVLFHKGRLTGTSAAGGEVLHDVQLFGVGTFGQGVTFRDVAFRGNGSGYAVSIDRSNRIIFDGCYGEEVGAGNHVFNVTSNTQVSVDGVMRINDKLNVPMYVDDVDTGVTGSTVPWSETRCVVTHRVDGRYWTPNFDASRSSSQVLRHTSWATGGQMRLAYDDGSTQTDFLRLQNTLIRPEVDDAINLGSASFRIKEYFGVAGSINTSDADQKQDIEEIPDEWLDAWGDVEWRRYKFRDAVTKKGDDARWHVGLIAQQVRDAFANRGLDAFSIGLLCYDEWEDTYEAKHEGGPEELILKAGSRYGIRYDEAQAMEAAWVRRALAG